MIYIGLYSKIFLYLGYLGLFTGLFQIKLELIQLLMKFFKHISYLL